MDLDFGKIVDNIKTTLSNFVDNAMAYFHDLTQWEMIAWGGEGLGLILVIVAIILW